MMMTMVVFASGAYLYIKDICNRQEVYHTFKAAIRDQKPEDVIVSISIVIGEREEPRYRKAA